MNIFGRIKNAFGGFLSGGNDASEGFMSYINRATTSGVTVNQQNSSTLSPYYAGIRNISEDIGKIPTYIFQELAEEIGGKKRIKNSTIDQIFNSSPGPDMTPMDMKQTITSHAIGWGNGYAEIVKNARGEPVELLPIHPGRVYVFRNDAGQIMYRIYPDFSIAGFNVNRTGHFVELAQDQIFHIKGLSMDGIVGLNLTQLAADSIGTGIAAQLFAGSFFGNGAWAGGILSHPGKLKPEARENLVESWNKKSRGANNGHRTVVLEEGMKFEQLMIDPRRAQFIELRKFTITEIARWLRIPPHKIADLERSTFSNIEEQNIDYITDTLLPWMTRWEQEIDRKLIKRNNQFSRFFPQALLRGDQASRSDYYVKMSNLGVLSINEIREMEDLNPIGPEGDGHYRPLNMALVGDTENEKEFGNDTKQLEPAQAPVEPDDDDDDDEIGDDSTDAGAKNLAPESKNMAPEKSKKKRAKKKKTKATPSI